MLTCFIAVVPSLLSPDGAEEHWRLRRLLALRWFLFIGLNGNASCLMFEACADVSFLEASRRAAARETRSMRH
jgi:hypothetical protein